MDDWYCQILALNKVNIQGKYNMKTLLTLLLLLSSNIIFAGDAGSAAEPEMKLYKGALGDIFDMGMTDKDTGTQTPSIDEGRDLYQVQLALAYSARDTALLEKKLPPPGNRTLKQEGYIQTARQTTRAFAYLAIASKIYNALDESRGNSIAADNFYKDDNFDDFSAYIDSVNIYDEKDFMTERDFSIMKAVTMGGFGSWNNESSPKEVGSYFVYYAKDKVYSTVNAEGYVIDPIHLSNLIANGDTQAALMNLGQSIYTTCASCPMRSD